MATGSTVPAVRTALVAAIGAALPGVQVTYGYPGEAVIRREGVYVDRVTGHHSIANIKAGRKQRDEEFTVTVCVHVARDKGTVSDVEARAFVLLQEVEDVVADDPSIGGVDGVVHATAGDFRMISDPTANGAAVVIEFDINVDSRLV